MGDRPGDGESESEGEKVRKKKTVSCCVDNGCSVWRTLHILMKGGEGRSQPCGEKGKREIGHTHTHTHRDGCVGNGGDTIPDFEEGIEIGGDCSIFLGKKGER